MPVLAPAPASCQPARLPRARRVHAVFVGLEITPRAVCGIESRDWRPEPARAIDCRRCLRKMSAP